MAAPTFVNSTVAAAGSGSIVLTVPAGVANGDLLLAFVSGGGTTPAGWTYIGYSTWARLASSEPASYTMTIGGSECRAAVHAWRPVSGSWASIGEAILSYWGHGTTSNYPDNLLFETCDYVVVAFGGRGGGYDSLAVPSGWTARGTSQGGSGGSNSVISASKTFTATSGFAGTSGSPWTYSGSPVALNTCTLVLRAPGQTTLALKSFNGPSARNDGAALALSMPPLFDAGDRLVAVQMCKRTIDGTVMSFNAASGWTKKNGDHIYVVSPTMVVGIGVLSKIAAGGDSVSIQTTPTPNYLEGYTLAFSRGPGNTAPSLPGTIGASDDTSNDGTFTFPGMTMESLGEAILITAGCLTQGNIRQSAAPAGWEYLMQLSQSTAGLQNSFVNGKIGSGASPGSVSSTLDASDRGVGVQFAVVLGRRLGGSRQIFVG